MLVLALLFRGKNALVISLSGGNHVKNDACQFVGGSGDPGRPSQTGAPLAIKDAQIGGVLSKAWAASRRARLTRLAVLRVLRKELFLRSSYCGGKSRPKKRRHGCCET